jgi:choline transport protein
MVGAAAMNFSIGFLMLITLLFRAGNIQDAIDSPTGQPYIEILLNATGSVAGTAVMVAYIILALMFCAINMVTTSSRQLYSFARDGGLPFAKTLSKVRTSFNTLQPRITNAPSRSPLGLTYQRTPSWLH